MGRIFKEHGRRYLDFSYVPPKLPHREQEIQVLLNLLTPITRGEVETYSIPVLYGKTGTGKTTTAKKVLELLSTMRMSITLNTVLINCGVDQKPFSVAQRLSRFTLDTYTRGYGPEEIIQMVYDALEIRDEYLIIVLDEVDELIRYDRGRFLYILTRIDEARDIKRIFPILITRKYEYILDLPKHIRNKISGPFIYFKPYTIKQMRDIVVDRVRLALNEEAITEGAIYVISYIASVNEGGDARTAISLLLNAGDLAERENSKKIFVEHVRRVYEESSGYLYRFLGKLEPKLTQLLLCLAKVLSKNIDEFIISNRVMGEIQLCMANQFMRSLTFREIEELLERLYERGILSKINGNYALLMMSPISILSAHEYFQ